MKYVHFIPCWMGEDTFLAASVAKLFVAHIIQQFGLPKELVHDRDPPFTSAFWKKFWWLVGTKTSASTAYHP